MNKFEDRGNWWYCDCYGPDCIKLTIEKNPDIDCPFVNGHYAIGIDPIVDTSTEKVSCSVFYMNIDYVVKHFKDDK